MQITLPTGSTGDMPEPLTHPSLRHPLTGQPLRTLGVTKTGKVIWPVLGGSGEPPTAPPPPTPSPPPTPPQPPAPSAGAVPPPAADPGSGLAGGDGGHGFPENTPLAQMTAEQREAYWRYHCRRHEDRVKSMADYEQLKQAKSAYDKLLDESRTEQEKSVAAALAQGRAEATADLGGRMVEAYVRAAATGRLDEQSITTLLEGIDRSRFIDASGEVDAERVYAWVNILAPAPASPPPTPSAQPGTTPPAAGAPATSPPTGRHVPDYGQGTPANPPAKGLEAGREIALARFGVKQPPAA